MKWNMELAGMAVGMTQAERAVLAKVENPE
jgi:hypothetical protein